MTTTTVLQPATTDPGEASQPGAATPVTPLLPAGPRRRPRRRVGTLSRLAILIVAVGAATALVVAAGVGVLALLAAHAGR